VRGSRRTGLAAAAAAGLALTALAATPAQAGNANNSEKFRQAVTVDGIMRHLTALQAIADANDGNRAAGTSGYDASADYVQGVLEDAGYAVTRQVFDINYQAPGELEQVSPTPTTYATDSYTGSGAGEVTATVTAVDLQFGLGNTSSSGCDAADFAGFPAGNIALLQRGTCPFADKAVNAQAAGAAAAIIFNQGDTAAPDRQGLIVGTLGTAPVTIPVVGGSYADGVDLADPPTTVARVFAAPIEVRPTVNLLTETSTGRDDNVVMLGAHLDGVEAGPGINDNGSGSATILETAVQLAKVNKVNNTVRFAWWGAEESGLLGSTHYVNDLVANNPDELDRIATYLNFDMVASPNYQIGVYDADQSTFPAPTGVPIPPGSVETEDVLTDYFDSVGQPWVDTQFSGRSDYQAFIVNGVAASGLFTGAEVPKPAAFVPLFGGTAGIAFDPNYHAVGDTIANINQTALDINSNAIAHATITLAQSTATINGARSAGKSGHPHPVKDGLQPAA
jgi:Zn-dependent M28 family amino/carboxypeptidase